jgi:YHS domain-containing protein
MAQDPVCHMAVDERTALSAQYQGETYYFCAQVCKDRFLANPEHYVKPRS